mmetsp:Transcript_34445/g.99985  ORF Transcript_34445/g.99985 Transcript_34445/m.99985 type:complete len:314 (-) Transcript_34445:132-1073(-)
MPRSKVPSETRSPIPSPKAAKLAAQLSAKIAAGVQIGCCASVTGKSNAISFKQQNSVAAGAFAFARPSNLSAKKACTSSGCSVVNSTNGVRKAYTVATPLELKSPSSRAIERMAYSNKATVNARNFFRWSTPRAAAVQARTRCTIFKAVRGGRSLKSASTARNVAGHSGAKGKSCSPFPLDVMSMSATWATVSNGGQPSPCLSSLSCSSAATSASSSTSSSSSPSALSPLSLPLSSASLASSTFAFSPGVCSRSPSSFAPTSASSSRPWARATRLRSSSSSFSAFALAISSGVLVRSLAMAFRSMAKVRTNWS